MSFACFGNCSFFDSLINIDAIQSIDLRRSSLICQIVLRQHIDTKTNMHMYRHVTCKYNDGQIYTYTYVCMNKSEMHN